MNSTEFARRRKQLMGMVGEDGIVILPSAPVRTRSRDVEYRYRQDSNFLYFFGKFFFFKSVFVSTYFY